MRHAVSFPTAHTRTQTVAMCVCVCACNCIDTLFTIDFTRLHSHLFKAKKKNFLMPSSANKARTHTQTLTHTQGLTLTLAHIQTDTHSHSHSLTVLYIHSRTELIHCLRYWLPFHCFLPSPFLSSLRFRFLPLAASYLLK